MSTVYIWVCTSMPFLYSVHMLRLSTCFIKENWWWWWWCHGLQEVSDSRVSWDVDGHQLSWHVHTAVKPWWWTVRACAVRYRRKPPTDRMTAAVGWHFILRQWVTVKPIHFTAVAAPLQQQCGGITYTHWVYWPVQQIRFSLGCWPLQARFHFLCLVTRSAASWNGRRYLN